MHSGRAGILGGVSQEERDLRPGRDARGPTVIRASFICISIAFLAALLLAPLATMGEFGAVSVVSGNVRGATSTMPLHIETLYMQYNYVGAFAVASLLTLLAVVTLVLKAIVERRGYAGR
jgi:sulfate transport system permease protein